MPFYINHEPPEVWTVRNKITDRVLGTHSSYDKALAQLRALYVHVPESQRAPPKGGGDFEFIKRIDPKDRVYLDLSSQAYTNKDSRLQRVDDFFYDPLLSTKRTAVYFDPLLQKVIISHRGTVDKSDIVQDAYLVAGLLSKSSRYKNALNIVASVVKKYQGYQIVNTGHSLGGKIAIELGKNLPYNDSKVVAFNPASSLADISEFAKCGIIPTDSRCKNLKNQKIYSIPFDPTSITYYFHPGDVYFKSKIKGINPHTLRNFTT